MENKRRTLIVDKRFQFHHMLEVLLLTFIAINLVVITVFVFFTGTIEAEANLALGVSVAVIEVVALSGILWMTRTSSNRIAGPVYRICRTLETVGKGDLTARITLRKGDHFAEQADSINAALKLLQERISSAQNLAQQLHAASDEKSIEQLRNKLREFRTDSDASREFPRGTEPSNGPEKALAKQNRDLGFTLIELMIILLVISILALISIPLYQGYAVRAQVSEGFMMADPIKRAVMEYYLENGAFPTDHEAAGVSPPGDYSTAYIDEIHVEEDGVIRVIYNIAALGPMRNNLLLHPRLESVGSLAWDCNDDSDPAAVPKRYLPPICRQ